MSIDVGKDHMAKVYHIEEESGYAKYLFTWIRRLYGCNITGPKSKFGDRLETPENPRELLNQFKKIKQMQQTSLQTHRSNTMKTYYNGPKGMRYGGSTRKPMMYGGMPKKRKKKMMGGMNTGMSAPMPMTNTMKPQMMAAG